MLEVLPDGRLLAYWFTYDLSGRQAWMLTLSEGSVAQGSTQLDLLQPVGGRFGPDFDPDDITTYRSTRDIVASGRFTPEERREEYRRRGKSPSGVIDGIYNDMYLEDGYGYNDEYRDWDADA